MHRSERTFIDLEDRLSRPSLSVQHALPTQSQSSTDSSNSFPPPSASLAYPSSEGTFILSPLLTLPPAFGSAYVGESFSCTLCANNELLPGLTNPKTISNVKIEVEMKIPSSGNPIPLSLGPDAEAEKKTGVDLEPGQSLQKIVNFDLKEEGSHVLTVTVTYTETTSTSGRVRTFRKLYQFVCKSCMVVRTKTGALPKSSSSKISKGRTWALEAQLENCGEETITLESVVLETVEGIRSHGINWDLLGAGEVMEKPVLMPADVYQVCFAVEEQLAEDGAGAMPVDGRIIFGILSLGWRGPMGNRGFLSTGSLGARIK
jgi:hypothetical protein